MAIPHWLFCIPEALVSLRDAPGVLYQPVVFAALGSVTDDQDGLIHNFGRALLDSCLLVHNVLDMLSMAIEIGPMVATAFWSTFSSSFGRSTHRVRVAP